MQKNSSLDYIYIFKYNFQGRLKIHIKAKMVFVFLTELNVVLIKNCKSSTIYWFFSQGSVLKIA